ncbi:MAG: MFS transporter [Nibricoccus sp.]
MIFSRRFLPLFVTQFVGAFCDNVFKNAFCFLCLFGLAQANHWNPGNTVQLIGGLFILPFVLVSGWAGYVSDVWDRHTFVRRLKTFEVFVMLGAAVALYYQSFYGMWAVIVALGVISALFGPLKYGLLPVYLKENELVAGNAWFEGGSFIAIVTGIIVGSKAATSVSERTWVAGLLFVLGVLGCATTYFLPAAPAAAKATVSPWSLKAFTRSTGDAMRVIHRVPVLWRSVLGISWSWGFGAVLLNFLPNYAKEVLQCDPSGARTFLLCFAIGIGVGSFLGQVLTHGKIRATYVPLAAISMSALIFVWILADSFAGDSLKAILYVVLSGLGIAGGIYAVPLYALMQHRSPADQRGRVISANNILNALFIVAGAVVAIVVSLIDARPMALLWVLGVGNLAAAVYMVWLVPESVLHTALRVLLRAVFRIEVRGLENFPNEGKRLIIANHTSWLDGALLAAFLPDKPVFAVHSRIAERRWVKPFMKWVTAYPLNPLEPLALKTLCACVEQNEPVAIFPEGRLSTTGGLMKIYDGAGFIAQKTGAKIVTVHIDGAHLSLFTRLGSKYRKRWFPRITITISPPVVMPADTSRDEATPFIYNLLTESACAAQIPEHSIYRELVVASRRHGSARTIWTSADGRTLNYAQILGRSAYLGTRFAEYTEPANIVGIMLPTSMEGALTFLGLQFGHRIPAWLNFTMGPKAFESTVRTAGIRTAVTSRKFVDAGNLEDRITILQQASVRILYLEDLRPNFLWKLRAAWIQFSLTRHYERHEQQWSSNGRDPRAAIMFTSGSSGLPKAVVLSHRNLLANVAQLRARIDFTHTDCVFNALPLFHAFGFTGGMLLPLLSGARAVLYPTPLHYGVIPEFIYSTNATIFFATNSFLNGYARKAHSYDFYALRYVFAGAEKLQPATQKLWNDRFGLRIFEGYGTTEASPALAMNTPLSNKPGTVGRLLPGIEYKLEDVPGILGGRLHFRGPNRMLGYYLPERPGHLVETDEWYDTGDIVSIDDQGFVTILGRAKRFAKIAGEMVSLAAVEEAVSTVTNGIVAVVSRPHPTKGEELIACTGDTALTMDAIREAVRAKGLSELNIPKQIKVLTQFPLLGTGKPDLVALQQSVTEPVASVSS